MIFSEMVGWKKDFTIPDFRLWLPFSFSGAKEMAGSPPPHHLNRTMNDPYLIFTLRTTR
jgi:hypothetical protein